jgi:hypothetical protein
MPSALESRLIQLLIRFIYVFMQFYKKLTRGSIEILRIKAMIKSLFPYLFKLPNNLWDI